MITFIKENFIFFIGSIVVVGLVIIVPLLGQNQRGDQGSLSQNFSTSLLGSNQTVSSAGKIAASADTQAAPPKTASKTAVKKAVKPVTPAKIVTPVSHRFFGEGNDD